MPRKSRFPTHGFKKSFSLAQVIYKLGGAVTREVCASNMGKTLSGPFQSLIGSTVKYGLITAKKNMLSITEAFKDIQCAYTDEDLLKAKQNVFLGIDFFQTFIKRIRDKDLDPSYYKKYLIKEFNLVEKEAAVVAPILIESIVSLSLLKDDKLPNLQSDLEPIAEPYIQEEPDEELISLTLRSDKLNLDLKIASLEDIAIVENAIYRLKINFLKSNLK